MGTTSKNNIIFVRGKNTSTVLQELQELVEPFGEVIFSEKILSQDEKEYIISLRFSTTTKANSFFFDYKDGKNNDVIRQAY